MELQNSNFGRTGSLSSIAGHDYAGNRVAAWNVSRKTKKARQISSAFAADFDYLDDHRVAGRVIYPAAGYSMAGLAIHQQIPSLNRKNSRLILRNLRFRKALPLSNHHSISLQLCYEPAQNEFTIYSKNQTLPNAAAMHATGEISHVTTDDQHESAGLSQVKREFQKSVDVGDFYQSLKQAGLDYGLFFKRIAAIHLHSEHNEALTKLVAHPDLAKTRDRWAQRITLLDAAFQSLGATLPADELGLFVPSQVRTLRVLGDFDSDLWCHVRLQKFTHRLVSGDITLFNAEGKRLVEITGLRCLKIASQRKAV